MHIRAARVTELPALQAIERSAVPAVAAAASAAGSGQWAGTGAGLVPRWICCWRASIHCYTVGHDLAGMTENGR